MGQIIPLHTLIKKLCSLKIVECNDRIKDYKATKVKNLIHVFHIWLLEFQMHPTLCEVYNFPVSN